MAIHQRDSMDAEIQGLVTIFGSENDSPSRWAGNSKYSFCKWLILCAHRAFVVNLLAEFRLSCARAWFHKASSTRSSCVLGDTAREAKSLVESMTDANRRSAIPESSRQFSVLGCGTKSNFGRMSRRQQSNCRLHFTGKQKDMIYRSEPIPVNPVNPVNPVIRNSNHEQSHIIHGGRNSS